MMTDAMSLVPPGYRVCTMPDGAFGTGVGPLFIRMDGTGFAFRVEARHCNAREVVHGGMLMTFADQVLGLTVQRAVETVNVATISLHCDLVSSAIPGDLVEGEAVVTRITRSVVFVRGSLRCGDRPVMTASGVWKRLKSMPTTASTADDASPALQSFQAQGRPGR